MRRREALRVGGVALAVPFGGCGALVSGTTETEDPDPAGETESGFEVTETGPLPVMSRTGSFTDRYPETAPFAEIVVGEPATAEKHHGVRVFNEFVAPRDVQIGLRRIDDGSSLIFRGNGTISSGGVYLAVVLWEVGAYDLRLDVTGEGTRLRASVLIKRGAWSTQGARHEVHIEEATLDVTPVGLQ